MSIKGLGKGLDALFGENATSASQGSVTLKLHEIIPNASQPRKIFDPQALDDLSDSIRQHGLLQPIAVRLLPDGKYQIIAGERRWRAAKLAGLSEVPAFVVEADDLHAMELALIENLQREDLNPIEEAEGFKSLIQDYGLTQEDTAARVGKSRPVVANALRLLQLPAPVIEAVQDGRLTSGHARALLQLASPDDQIAVAEKIIAAQLSVRQTEKLVKKMCQEITGDPSSPEQSVSNIEDVERNLSSTLGRRVRIVSGRSKGRFELEFYGPDDFDFLTSLLSGLSGISSAGGNDRDGQ